MSTHLVPNTTSSQGVYHLPDTKLSHDRNIFSSRLLDKCVVEQLATRVVERNAIRTHHKGKVSWVLHTPFCHHSFMHACNVVITQLQNEQVNFIVGVVFLVPQICK